MAKAAEREAMVPAKTFIEAWRKSKTFDDVLKKLGGKPQTHKVRAYSFRKKGIPLQKFATERSGMNVAELAAFSLSFGPVEGAAKKNGKAKNGKK
jgi:hypothetical protein